MRWLPDCEPKCSKRISGPIEEARGKAMVLRYGEPVPIRIGRVVKKWWRLARQRF